MSAVPGKAGTNFSAFVAMIDVLREQTEGQSLRGIIEQMLESSGLVEHFRTEKKAPTASRTCRNWSTPPKASSRKKALAAMPGPAAG